VLKFGNGTPPLGVRAVHPSVGCGAKSSFLCTFIGSRPRELKERFARKGKAIDKSFRAVLNETLGVSLIEAQL